LDGIVLLPPQDSGHTVPNAADFLRFRLKPHLQDHAAANAERRGAK
jgi:hypothetical protein